jgi:S1-C subfamily serine protease
MASTDGPFHNLYLRATRAIAGRPLDQVVQQTRAIVGPPIDDLEGDARDGLQALKDGIEPTPAQVAALQAVVRAMRPSVMSKSGTVPALDDQTKPVFAEWDEFAERVAPFLYTIGRIDAKPRGALPATACGTGFLVTDTLLLTNHHVLTAVSAGTDVLVPGDALVDFGQEYMSPGQPPVTIESVYAIHPDVDAVLLRLSSPVAADRKPLSWEADVVEAGQAVVAIGYPFPDSERNPLFVERVFGSKFGVKRLAPGVISKRRADSIYHDCSTLGGNSGSPVLDMKTSRVVGLHTEGFFLSQNQAVSATALQSFVQTAGA